MRSILFLALVACAGTSKPASQPLGSRGPRASEHTTAAREEDEVARQRAMYPETHRSDATGRSDQLLVGDRFHRTWDTAADHERAAAIHRSTADALHAEYEAACGERSGADVTVSPIVRYGIGGEATKTGVIIYLSGFAGTPARLMADLRCHRAWMMLAPMDMDTCPLDLDGLVIDVEGLKEGLRLTLSIKNPELVPELQRRTAQDLELGHNR